MPWTPRLQRIYPPPPPPKQHARTVHIVLKTGSHYTRPAYKVENAPPCFVVVTGPGYEDWLRGVDIESIRLEDM